jgi:cytochrome c551/c552
MSIQGRRRAAPALVTIFAALALAGGGGLLLASSGSERTVRESTVDGLNLRLMLARWILDEMEHDGSGFAMPTSMMPDIPSHEVERLRVEIELHNRGAESRLFRLAELRLRSEAGGEWSPASDGLPEEVNIAPGMRLNRTAYFDYFDEGGKDAQLRTELRLVWTRGESSAAMGVPHPPSHDHSGEEETFEPIDWPEFVEDLPEGDPGSGWFLFTTKHACVSCHGHPGLPGSNTLGPSLADVAQVAATRVPGKPAAQYLYESIVDPEAFRAPAPPNPSGEAVQSMPLPDVNEQEVADLVAYLLQQRRNP